MLYNFIYMCIVNICSVTYEGILKIDMFDRKSIKKDILIIFLILKCHIDIS